MDCVLPGDLLVLAKFFVLVTALIILDFPTLDLPIKHISGIFKFPSTGFWQVDFDISWFSDSQGASNYIECYIMLSENSGGAYNDMARGRGALHGSLATDTSHASSLMKISNITTNYMIIGTGEDNYIDTRYYTLIVTPSPSILLDSIIDPSCGICFDGSISVNIDYAFPYTMSWIGPSFYSDLEDISSLERGQYNLVINTNFAC